MQNCNVSEINVFLLFMQKKTQDGHQNWRGNHFLGKKLPDDSADILGFKTFAKIALSSTVSEINAFLHVAQKFKMAAKNGGENSFWEKSPDHSADTRGR